MAPNGDRLQSQSAQLEQTPVECDAGPPTTDSEVMIECLENGCEIVSISADNVDFRSELPIYLTRLRGDG